MTRNCDPTEQQERFERMEALYEADGRHDPAHPDHGIYSGLMRQQQEQEVAK